MTRTTARAYPNIALIKYWGKRDSTLMLPATGSLSMTLDRFPTTTSVSLIADADTDVFELNGRPADEEQTRRVTRFLDLVRAQAGARTYARVESHNEAPTGAGLASSAAGFAALATAASAAYGLALSPAELSRLARRGSGSATRSVLGGLVVWHAGDDDESSFAEPVQGPDLRMVIVIVDENRKAISSRDAMQRTALTSPFHEAWITSTAQSLEAMRTACADGDLSRIGRIAETNALRMHAVIQAADPPIRYLTAGSLAVLDAVEQLRRDGIEAYATADAGPNVVVITRPEDAADVAEAMAPLGRVTITGPGPAAVLLTQEDAR